MAEKKAAATEEEPSGKKKGGKLPLIIIAIVLLGGGAVVGMKMTAKKEPEGPPPLVLGAIEPLGNEFLVNLADGRSYLRANISVHLEKNAKAEEFKKQLPTVRDTIILCLSSKTMEEVNSVVGKESLKREIAYQVNEVLSEIEEKKDEKHEEAPAVSSASAVDAQGKPIAATAAVVDAHGKPLATAPTVDAHGKPLPSKPATAPSIKKEDANLKPWDVPKAMRKYPSWDSDTGPVLMVYFTDFATQ